MVLLGPSQEETINGERQPVQYNVSLRDLYTS